MELSALAWVLLACLGGSWFILSVEIFATLYLVLARKRKEPERWPSFSILKPLAGHDDELEANLESHVHLDYPGEYEVLLGVRSETDPAYPIAKAFAAKHPQRVRLYLQDGEPGLNPKVNQLITLTARANGELLALTDSNVRVAPHYLREHAAFLASRPQIGLTSNAFLGVGEVSFGSILDNLTLAGSVMPPIGTGDVLLRLTQIVSKSIAIKRAALQAVGGWEAFKDLLAEDQRLGQALLKKGYRTAICRTPVLTVQKSQPFSHFWKRHTRWAMIRFIVLPAVYLEPFMNPLVMSLLFAAAAWRVPWAWWLVAMSAAFSAVFTQVAAVMGRGVGFRAQHLLLMPLRDVLFFAIWLRGAFLRTVDWRGNVLRVGRETRLSR